MLMMARVAGKVVRAFLARRQPCVPADAAAEARGWVALPESGFTPPFGCVANAESHQDWSSLSPLLGSPQRTTA
jgi:hypothetical protein